MCYFHVTENIEKYLKPFSKSTADEFKEDVCTLQTSLQVKQCLRKPLDFFLKKCRKNTDARVLGLVDDFEEQWMKKLPCWYEGAALDCPSTNNGLEATTAIIKREHTIRTRLPLPQFLHNVTDSLESWSKWRNPSSVDCLPFATTPSISLPQWTSAFQWAVHNYEVLERKEEDTLFFFVHSARLKASKISSNCVRKFEKEEGTWRTFDKFKEWHSRIWHIKVSDEGASCTCPIFLKMQVPM